METTYHSIDKTKKNMFFLFGSGSRGGGRGGGHGGGRGRGAAAARTKYAELAAGSPSLEKKIEFFLVSEIFNFL